ncbi:hypothetical protein WICPIJ_002336 [Wickerhamomyces pijperi]|uniref:Amino acid permease/ SLC12A domain-containing protein n=1 Tax=Wickerhamomyces pijperi TaxID=599730 RepID=A0A9P8Q9Y2_WICPI|nr:hypothetical protein WICPIJ_002336 [Wickerhamomyces pijperi]
MSTSRRAFVGETNQAAIAVAAAPPLTTRTSSDSEKKELLNVDTNEITDSSDKEAQLQSDDLENQLDEGGEAEEKQGSVFGADRGKLKKGLSQRHLQMIALVGVFGTGIFLFSGSILHTAGPLGTLLCFMIIALIVGLNQTCVAEVACLVPVTSATVRHLEQFVDPALSFSYGWILVWDCVIPADISAAALIISYWETNIHQGVWITLIILGVAASTFLPIRHYGEMEFLCGVLKLVLLLILIVTSIVITTGKATSQGTAIGFKYWSAPSGPFQEYLTTGSLGRFAAFYKGLSGVVFSFGGVQSVPNLAAEVTHPRRAIFRSCKRVFYRVSALMILTIFCLTLIIPSNHPSITSSAGGAESSPFVIAMKEAGIKGMPHFINAMVLMSAFSSACGDVVAASRTLFALAVKRQAPQLFLKTSKSGIPYWGCAFCLLFSPLAFMGLSQSGAVVFGWCQDLISANQLVGWILIAWNHIALGRAMKCQGYSRDRLPHTISFAPAAAWISGIASFILLLTAGFQNFVPGHFEWSSFITTYFIIPLTSGLFIFWKLFKKTKYVAPNDIDLAALFRDVEQNPEPPYKPLKGWRWLTIIWS